MLDRKCEHRWLVAARLEIADLVVAAAVVAMNAAADDDDDDAVDASLWMIVERCDGCCLSIHQPSPRHPCVPKQHYPLLLLCREAWFLFRVVFSVGLLLLIVWGHIQYVYK